MEKFQRDFRQYRAERDERMRQLDRWVEEERERVQPRARQRQPIMISVGIRVIGRYGLQPYPSKK